MKPFLSVLVITYQHEKFIAQCLESVLSQQTDFVFEVVVGDDFSQDQTHSLLLNFEKRDPRVRIVRQPANSGGAKNFREALAACEGEWIAWCEGDDFWIDSRKLQKQVDRLRQNPRATLCFSRARIFNQQTQVYENDPFPSRELNLSPVLERSDLLYGNMIPTCSTVFRKQAVWPLPDWYGQWPLGDWTLYLLALREGHQALFVDEELSAYRVHPQGMWSSLSRRQSVEKLIPVLNFMISIEPLAMDRRRLTSNLLAQEVKLWLLDLSEKKWMSSLERGWLVLKTALKADWSLKRYILLFRKFKRFS